MMYVNLCEPEQALHWSNCLPRVLCYRTSLLWQQPHAMMQH